MSNQNLNSLFLLALLGLQLKTTTTLLKKCNLKEIYSFKSLLLLLASILLGLTVHLGIIMSYAP
jgi:uncharacterized membrane protein